MERDDAVAEWSCWLAITEDLAKEELRSDYETPARLRRINLACARNEKGGLMA